MAAASSIDRRGPWAAEAIDVVRAASGGLLFGVPLLFTMEVWWTGSRSAPAQALGMVALTFVPVILLNRTSGFRSTKDVRWRDAALDSIEAVAIGVVLSALVLFVLREVTAETPLREGLGKVAYETFPFCLGVAVAHHFLGRGRSEDDDSEGDDGHDEATINATVADVGATVVGAVFVAITIAPTDEIPLLVSAMSAGWLLVVVAASLVVTYAIVFVAGFAGEEARHSQEGLLQHPLTETVACYLLALASAALMLWVFQRFEGPGSAMLGQVVVLGLPAAVGGAAGRLAI